MALIIQSDECALEMLMLRTSVVAIRCCRTLMSRDMRVPTMWYVRPAKPQIRLGIRPV